VAGKKVASSTVPMSNWVKRSGKAVHDVLAE
jgi:hypothetical protein